MIASIQKALGHIFFLFNYIIKAQVAQPAIYDRMAMVTATEGSSSNTATAMAAGLLA